MPRSGPRTVRRYSDEFKLAAVRLSQEPGIQVQTVAAALAIHPFMLSKWRKDAREGRLRGVAPKGPTATQTRELARLQQLEREYALLQEEHDLLKKAIRFCSARKATSTRSSRASSSRTTRGEA
jgi:transposase